MNEKRVVIDTNVVVSGLLGGGLPGKIVEAWLLGFIFPVHSSELKREINEIILRPNVKKLLDAHGPRNIRATIGTMFNKGLSVIPKPIEEVLFTDKDDHFLYELAVTAGAVAIVTGDKKLLRLKRVANIEILSPESFCRKFKIK